MSELELLQSMAHSPISNYGLPGLTSWLLGQPGPHGCVRLFHSQIEQMENITPHSHRFDFSCRVLQGTVKNILWEEDPEGELYMASSLKGGLGDYSLLELDGSTYSRKTSNYKAGATYQMKADQIHSIAFGRDAWVLFFEGPPASSSTIVLQPVCNEEVVPTFRVAPWMFKRSPSP